MLKRLFKGTIFYSIFWMKCPRCHQSDLFETPTYSFKNFFGMPKHCSNCHQKFELEMGFYYGAMYVSYGLNVALGVAIFVAFSVLYPDFELHYYLITTSLSILIFAPLVFRISRAIWINFFVKYEPGASDKKSIE